LQLLAWHRRFHQMRSNDDDQIGLRFLEGSATEEGAQHWDLANPRQLRLVCAVLVVEQASYRKALTIPEFDRDMGPANDEPRDRDPAAVGKCTGGIDVTDLGLNFE